MINLNELFKDNSSNNIEPYIFNYKNSYKIKGYKFSIDDNTYFVCNEDGEITFGLITDDNNLITSPTNLGKNQFKILSNVVQCIKLFLEEKPKEIFFSGNIKNGLGKLYKTIFNRLQDENYISFTDSKSELATYFYYVRKDIFKPSKYNIDNGSLRNYKIEEKSKYSQNSLEKNMKRKINEAVTISVQNTKNGYNNNVTMKFDDVNELAQLIKNAGIGDYVEINSELPDNVNIGYSDAFDFGDRGNEELEPYNILATEVGYSSECLVIYVDNSVVDVVIQYTNQQYNLNPIDIISYDDYTALIYTCGDICSVSEFLVNELLNICPGMIYGSNLIDSYEEIEEGASIDAAIPYEYDAEESPYNIKGPAHQMNLRYVPGLMADNPMTDELRESVEDKALILSKIYKIGQECGKVCHEAGDENGEVKRNALRTVLHNHEKEIENGEISKLEIKKEFRRGFENFKGLKESAENNKVIVIVTVDDNIDKKTRDKIIDILGNYTDNRIGFRRNYNKNNKRIAEITAKNIDSKDVKEIENTIWKIKDVNDIEILDNKIKESVENKDSELLKIASKYFDFDSFNETNSGDDFKEVAVWSVEKALKAAYELGKKSK